MFPKEFGEKKDAAVDKAMGAKPPPFAKKGDDEEAEGEKPPEHGDITVDELYEKATPEERATIEAICARLDE